MSDLAQAPLRVMFSRPSNISPQEYVYLTPHAQIQTPLNATSGTSKRALTKIVFSTDAKDNCPHVQHFHQQCHDVNAEAQGCRYKRMCPAMPKCLEVEISRHFLVFHEWWNFQAPIPTHLATVCLQGHKVAKCTLQGSKELGTSCLWGGHCKQGARHRNGAVSSDRHISESGKRTHCSQISDLERLHIFLQIFGVASLRWTNSISFRIGGALG